MPANECVPYKEPGSAFTGKATAGITGKRFVKISGNRTGGPGLSTDLANVYQIAHCGAGGVAVGVSKHDIANGALGGVHAEPGIVVPVTAGANLTAGTKVMSDANGKAVPYVAGVSPAAPGDPLVIAVPAGTVLNGASADADAEIKLAL